MGEKNPRWTYVVIFALLAVVVALAAKVFRGQKLESAGSPPRTEKSAPAAADKDRQVEDLNIELAQLRNDAEANTKRVRELESKLDETKKALGAAQQKLKAAQKQTDKVAAAPPAAREKTAAKSVETSPPPAAKRITEAGTYEVVRDSAVLEKPSVSAREVALVQRGTIINVVGSQGEWLEVRSKYGKPPGYIRRDDVKLRQGESEGR
jgi:chromosome segregation ATPase